MEIVPLGHRLLFPRVIRGAADELVCLVRPVADGRRFSQIRTVDRPLWPGVFLSLILIGRAAAAAPGDGLAEVVDGGDGVLGIEGSGEAGDSSRFWILLYLG